MAHAKSDFISKDVRGECKHTSNQAFILKLTDLLKIREESITGNLREPVLQIEFVGQVGKSTKLAVLGWSSFMQHWKFKPKELIGLCTVDHFQIGKQFVLQKAAWTAYLGKSPLTVVFRVTFNQPDEKDTPGSNSFALVDWRTYLMLREAMNA